MDAKDPTTNHNHAPATTITHASNITMVSQGASNDLLLLETLPRHPDISNYWTELVPGSRDGDMGRIWSWMDSPLTKELVFWIHAPAGLGKSAFARKLKEELRSQHRLAAFIFFRRLPLEWGPETVIRLIGAEIARIHREAVAAVARAVHQCHGASLGLHVEKFIRDPVLSLRLPHPLIIIMDGLTEWTSHGHFIEHLAQLAPYPSLIRFVILGRSEPREGRQNVHIRSYKLAPVSPEFMARYLNDRFDIIEWKDGGRAPPEDVLRLAALAGGDFTRMEEVVSIIFDLPASSYDDIPNSIYNMALSIPLDTPVDRINHKITLNRVYLWSSATGSPNPQGI
ncbi:hypothetical protein FA13DRAFT_1798041 [Coprinellus micaceus]|uniref:Nephrocystin 3-like N-terminal domain-containing protein n=1 Tax=Coprinellus micaceus TaxID=71717 RepID=A0A4Y7SNG6_COPMI|nr:hypothetical protein FA13DRAFT_1798041 [Coprinellus micaceus]